MSDYLPPLPEDWNQCLAVAAHPDDIEYGMASAVARWTQQGKSVTYLLVTRGEAGIDGMPPDQAAKVREQEERAGAREVGVEVVEFLDYPDGVVQEGLQLRSDIARIIRRRRPEVIVCGSYAIRMAFATVNQADHRAVGLATLDAARDAGNRWIFPHLVDDDGLQPWSGVRFVAYGGDAQSSHGVDITGEPLERGIASLAAHASYLDGLGDAKPDPRRFLTWLAEESGALMSAEAAVLFDVHFLRREIPPRWQS